MKNVLAGNKTFWTSTDGQSNVFLGYEVAQAASTASYNVGLGRQCFEQLTTGRFNIGIGYQAIDNLQSGFRNTAIGQYAGDTLTTGSNNSFLGNYATPSSATVSNEITLGNSDITHFRIPGIGCSISEGGAVITGIVTATSFSGSGANLTGITAGYWGQDSVGLNTNTSVGVNTSTINDKDLQGIGNTFNGMYIANGMMIYDNALSGNHYIGTAFNGLMAGPVTIHGTLSVDGQYVVV